MNKEFHKSFFVVSDNDVVGLFGSSTNKLRCKKCGTILPDNEKLKRHQEKAHNKKKEKCRVCGTEFDTSDDLRKHKKSCK